MRTPRLTVLNFIDLHIDLPMDFCRSSSSTHRPLRNILLNVHLALVHSALVYERILMLAVLEREEERRHREDHRREEDDDVQGKRAVVVTLVLIDQVAQGRHDVQVKRPILTRVFSYTRNARVWGLAGGFSVGCGSFGARLAALRHSAAAVA